MFERSYATSGEVMKGFWFLGNLSLLENLLRLFLNLLLLQHLALFFASCDSLMTLTDERGGVEIFSVFIVTILPRSFFHTEVSCWRSELFCELIGWSRRALLRKRLETLEWHAGNNLWTANFYIV